MSSNHEKRELTLQDLGERAHRAGYDTIMNGSPEAIKWARTLVLQIHILAGLFGVRLPKPIVDEGVRIKWYLGECRIELRVIAFAQRPVEVTEHSPRKNMGTFLIHWGITTVRFIFEYSS